MKKRSTIIFFLFLLISSMGTYFVWYQDLSVFLEKAWFTISKKQLPNTPLVIFIIPLILTSIVTILQSKIPSGAKKQFYKLRSNSFGFHLKAFSPIEASKEIVPKSETHQFIEFEDRKDLLKSADIFKAKKCFVIGRRGVGKTKLISKRLHDLAQFQISCTVLIPSSSILREDELNIYPNSDIYKKQYGVLLLDDLGNFTIENEKEITDQEIINFSDNPIRFLKALESYITRLGKKYDKFSVICTLRPDNARANLIEFIEDLGYNKIYLDSHDEKNIMLFLKEYSSRNKADLLSRKDIEFIIINNIGTLSQVKTAVDSGGKILEESVQSRKLDEMKIESQIVNSIIDSISFLSANNIPSYKILVKLLTNNNLSLRDKYKFRFKQKSILDYLSLWVKEIGDKFYLAPGLIPKTSGISNNDFEKCLMHLIIQFKTNTSLGPILRSLAYILSLRIEYKGISIELYKEYLNVYNNDQSASYDLAILYSRKNQEDEALKILEKLYNKEKNKSRLSYLLYAALGYSLGNLKKYEKAEKILREGLENYKNNKTLLKTLVIVLDRAGKRNESIELSKYIIENFNDTTQYLDLGISYDRSGQLKEAVETLLKGYEADPNNDNIKKSLSWVLGEIKYLNNNVLSKEIIDALPATPIGLNIKSKFYYEIGYKIIAKKLYNVLIKQKDLSGNDFYWVADLMIFFDDYDAAVTFLHHVKGGYNPYLLNLLLAQCYYHKNENSDAELYYNKALEINPGGTNALLGLGSIQYNKANYENAEIYIRQAIMLNPQLDFAWTLLYKSVLNKNDKKEIISFFETYANKTSKNSIILYYLGKLLVDIDKKKAEMFFIESESKDSSNPYALSSLVEISLEKKNYEDALAIQEKLVKLFPDNHFAQSYMAYIYLRLGQTKNEKDYFRQGIQHAEKALKIKHDFSTIKTLGELYFELDEYKKSEDCYNAALEEDKNDWYAMYGLARIYTLHHRKFSEARDLLTNALNFEPENPQIYMGLYYANKNLQKDKYDNLHLIKILEKAKCLNPNHYLPWTRLGEEYFWKAEKEGKGLEIAEQHILKSLELNPQNYQTYSFLAYFYRVNDEYEKSLKCNFILLEKGIAKWQDYYSISLCYRRLKNYKEAVDYFLKTLELQKNHRVILKTIQFYNELLLCNEVESAKKLEKLLLDVGFDNLYEILSEKGKDEIHLTSGLRRLIRSKLFIKQIKNESDQLYNFVKNCEALTNLAIIYYNLNEEEKTNLILTQCNKNTHYLVAAKGEIEILKGNSQEALKYYKSALKLSPGNKEYKEVIEDLTQLLV